MKIKSIVALCLSMVFGAGVFAGLNQVVDNGDETFAATTSSKASIQIWTYDQNQKGANRIKITSATYDTNYNSDDLVCWFNNYKGTCSGLHTNNTTASIKDGVITVTQQNFANGRHYESDGRHYNIVFPYFVSKINFSLHMSGASDYQIYTGSINSRVRRVLGVYYNDGGKGTWSLPYGNDVSVNTSFTTNTITKKEYNGKSSTVTRYQYSSIGSIAGADSGDMKFAGWYKESGLTTRLSTNSPVTGDMTIYGKYVETHYIYVAINGAKWDKGVYAYSWVDGTTDYPHKPWPGTNYTTNAQGVKFVTKNSIDYGLVRIPVFEGFGDYIILNTGDGVFQTNTFKITLGAYYMETDSTNSTGDVKDVAAAAKFVFELNEERSAVTAADKIKAESICGLDPVTWVERYDDLSAEAQAAVNNATVNTYDPNGGATLQNVSFEDVIEQFRTMIDDLNGLNTLLKVSNNNSYNFVLIALIASSSLLFAVIYTKRRKSSTSK